MAKSVHNEEKTIKFDEVGVLAFSERMPFILKEAVFNGIILETLYFYSWSWQSVFRNLLRTPEELTGDDYEAQARVYLGFKAV